MMVVTGVQSMILSVCAKLRIPDKGGCGGIVVWCQNACVWPQEAAVERPMSTP